MPFSSSSSSSSSDSRPFLLVLWLNRLLFERVNICVLFVFIILIYLTVAAATAAAAAAVTDVQVDQVDGLLLMGMSSSSSASAVPLSHNAALHKRAVRPKKSHAPARHRQLPQVGHHRHKKHKHKQSIIELTHSKSFVRDVVTVGTGIRRRRRNGIRYRDRGFFHRLDCCCSC